MVVTTFWHLALVQYYCRVAAALLGPPLAADAQQALLAHEEEKMAESYNPETCFKCGEAGHWGQECEMVHLRKLQRMVVTT